MTIDEIKEFFKENKKMRGTLTSGEVATIMSVCPFLTLEMDRNSQEYYYSIKCEHLKSIEDKGFFNDLKTLGWSLSDDFNFLVLYV